MIMQCRCRICNTWFPPGDPDMYGNQTCPHCGSTNVEIRERENDDGRTDL